MLASSIRLTPILKARIIRLARLGKKEHEIVKQLGLKWPQYKLWKLNDHKNIRSEIIKARREYMLEQTENVFHEALHININNMGINKKGENYVYKDASLLRIKVDAAQNVREAMEKKTFAKRYELTGADGTPLMGNLLDEIEALPYMLHGAPEDDKILEEQDDDDEPEDKERDK